MKGKGTRMMYRQGDVLIVATSWSAGEAVPRDAGRVVLAYGEVTGHAHAIASPEAQMLHDPDTDRSFLRVLAEGGVALDHEEHATITLPRGDYEIIHQREYTPYGERRVAD